MSSSEPHPVRTDGGWKLQNTYAALPPVFHAAVGPTRVVAPRLVILNGRLATELGFGPESFAEAPGVEILAGNRLPPGSVPLAQAYAGHQYGHFTTLGDGRAVLLGEQIAPSGESFDIQLKGAGPTPFSRRGDGRAALGPMLREYVISEAMHALGIPTTRSLAVVATGEDVLREERVPGAVLTRVAASHIRVGTFQWAAAAGDEGELRALVDYTVRRHYPELREAPNRAKALLDAVVGRQAALLAQWMLVGFVHGVMNTDNMAVSGETIDYGPCAFMDAYDPATVFSSIDRQGRYAYGNQPAIAQWNLARFAETLLPLFDADEKKAVSLAEESIHRFADLFQQRWLAGMRRKLGLFNEEPEDADLVKTLLDWMRATHADFTNTFGILAQNGAPEAGFHPDADFERWRERWRARLVRQPWSEAESLRLRRESTPAFIPRNHLVEAALDAAKQGDLGMLERLLDVLSQPFGYERDAASFRVPAPVSDARYQTFCGT